MTASRSANSNFAGVPVKGPGFTFDFTRQLEKARVAVVMSSSEISRKGFPHHVVSNASNLMYIPPTIPAILYPPPGTHAPCATSQVSGQGFDGCVPSVTDI